MNNGTKTVRMELPIIKGNKKSKSTVTWETFIVTWVFIGGKVAAREIRTESGGPVEEVGVQWATRYERERQFEWAEA